MNFPIKSFSSGELSPLLDARSDVEKYDAGCRHLENFIARIYGVAERRPGTQFIDGATYLADPLDLTHTTPISTSAELQAMADDLAGHFYLTNDIDMTGVDFTPVGTLAVPFTGTLDGCGYTISNLTVDDAALLTGGGLFGALSGATVYCLLISDAYINVYTDCGILAGYAKDSLIQRVDIINGAINVNTGGFVSGLLGDAGYDSGKPNTIKSCIVYSVAIMFSGYSAYCSLFVSRFFGTCTDCYSSGTLTMVTSGGCWNGGFVGFARANSSYTRCETTGVLSTPSETDLTNGFYTNGGFAGKIENTTVTFYDCYFLKTLNELAFGGEDEVQRFSPDSGTWPPTGGHYHITWDGKTTAAITYNASETVTQAACDAVFGSGVLEIYGNQPRQGNPQYIFFRKQYSRTNVALATVDATALTGTDAPYTMTVAVENEVVYPANTTTPISRTGVVVPSWARRCVPFIYSEDIAYVIAFGPNYTQVYYDGAPLLDGNGDPVIVDTPYLVKDLLQLHIKQIADTMWIVHPDYPPMKLTRTSVTSFSLDEIEFTTGPFLTRNDLEVEDDVTLACSVTDVDDAGILTASDDVFESGHVNALFKLTHPRANTRTTKEWTGTSTTDDCTPLDVEGTFTFTTHGTWTAEVQLMRRENSDEDDDWEVYRSWLHKPDDPNISLSATEDAKNVEYKAKLISHTVSSTVTIDIVCHNYSQCGIVRIDHVVGAKNATVTVLAELASTDATKKWAEGAWSDVQGYPSAVTFYEERCVYAGEIAGILAAGEMVWFSHSGDYDNFSEGIKDADSFTLQIVTTNTIRWIESLESLLIGTTGDEWRVASNKLDTPLTPTNFSVKQQSSYGSKNIQPVRVNDVILFVDFVGRKIRELTYRDEVAKYVAPDLNALAEHITLSGVVCIAHQKHPDSILWCVLDDGTLLSMTYERDQNVVGWSKHPIDGLVQSVCIIPGETEDEIWLIISRTILNQSVTYVERFAPRNFGTELEDAFFVDCGITFEADTATTTVTGLEHLVGETVAILADGIVQTSKVVDVDGEIELDTAANKVQVGLPYTYKLEPMRPDVSTQGGTTHGSIMKVAEMVISFLDTMNTKYGSFDDKLFDIDWTNVAWTNTGEIDGLFTGDVVVSVDGGFTIDNPLIISGNDPLPCVVRAMIPRMERTGR